MQIGQIPIPTVSAISAKLLRDVEPIYALGFDGPVPFEESANPAQLKFTAHLIRDSVYTAPLRTQLEHILSLTDLSECYNRLIPLATSKYHYNGYLSVGEIKPDTPSTPNYQKIEFSATFYDAARYQCAMESAPRVPVNDFSLVLGVGDTHSYIPLPIGAIHDADLTTITRNGKDGTMTLIQGDSTTNLIRFDSPAQEINVGECKVFDTITPNNIIETTWFQTFTPLHTFAGDIVIENSLYRIIVSKSTSSVILYYYLISEYVLMDSLTMGAFTQCTILELTPDNVQLRVNTGEVITLARGKYPEINSSINAILYTIGTMSDASTSSDNFLAHSTTNVYIVSNTHFTITQATKSMGTGRKWFIHTSAAPAPIAAQAMVDSYMERTLVLR